MRTKLKSFLVFKEGYALFVVLAMASIIGVISMLVFHKSTMGIIYSSGLKDTVRAYHGAVSAENVALDLLKRDSNSWDGPEDDWYGPMSYFYRGMSIFVRITDECGKLNVNKVASSSVHFNMLLRLFDIAAIPEIIAYYIRDWVDSDDESEYGAERFFYQAYGYVPSNAELKSIHELMYIKSIDEGTFRILKNFLTVYGDGKINVNSAPREVLMAIDPEITGDVADSIIEARPIRSLEKLNDIPGITPEIYYRIKPFLTTRCNYFRIEASATSGSTEMSIVAYASRNRFLEWKVK